jgi:hypothetical protein
MRWHHVNTNHNGLVRHAHNSNAWAHIDEIWPDFVTDPSGCTRWGKSFQQPIQQLSTWQIFIFNYNLPLGLTTNEFFLMMVMLILSKEFVKNNNVDVYLVPLVKKL